MGGDFVRGFIIQVTNYANIKFPAENICSVMEYAAVEEVQLKVFGQQVGGHSLLLKLSDQEVCKPLLSREQFFYESIPQELRNYTPEYYGTSSSSDP